MTDIDFEIEDQWQEEENGGDEDCEYMQLGCLFPGFCVMPGVHYKHECHTPEMIESFSGGDRTDG